MARLLTLLLLVGLPASADEAPSPDEPGSELDVAVRIFEQRAERYGLLEDDGASKRKSRPTAAWHGRVYEFFRNNALDAVPHEIVQAGREQNVLRRNQFGVSLSGPIVIPKLYNGAGRTFFTFSYEGVRERVGRSRLSSVPTLRQRQGDFGDLVDGAGRPMAVYDPATTAPDQSRLPFPNNRIPAARLDPVAERIRAFYPKPNVSIGPFLENNLFTNPAEVNTPDGFVSTIDHNLFERHKLTVELDYSKGFRGGARDLDIPESPGPRDVDFVNRSFSVRDTYAVSPSAVLQLSFEADSETARTDGFEDGRPYAAELGLPGVQGGGVFPRIRFSRDLAGLGADDDSHFREAEHDFELEAGLSWKQGKHQWAMEASAEHEQENVWVLELPAGGYEFSPLLTGLPGNNNTGSPFASFLLGMASRAEVTDQPFPFYFRETRLEFSLRDQVAFAPTLNATFSVSMDVYRGRTEEFDHQSTVDLDAVNPANGMPGAVVFAGRGGEGRRFLPLQTPIDFSAGIAWSPTADRNTVVRAGFEWDEEGLDVGSSFGTMGFQGVRQPIPPNRQLEPALVLRDGFSPAAHPLPDLRPEVANDTSPDVFPDPSRTPREIELEVSVEQRWLWNLIARLSYSYERGRWRSVSTNDAALNRIAVDALRFGDRLEEESFRRGLRPFPQFQILRTTDYPLGRSGRHETELRIEKRLSSGLAFRTELEYRRSYDDYDGDGGPQDPANRAAEWALNPDASPLRFEVSYSYELPFGRGRRYFRRAGPLSAALSDWQISGVTTWRSGEPIELEPRFNRTGGVVPFLRANVVPGVDPHVDEPGPQRWFNPDAFVNPPDFALGNGPRSHPTLRNPSRVNHDLALSKRISLSSERSLEVLVQAFNFINTANWNEPDAEIGSFAAPNVNAGRIIGSRGGRVMQLGLRYNF